MKTPIVLLEGDQLEIDFDQIGFDPDRPQYSICPKCDSQIIKLSDGCGVCGWSQNEKLQGDKLSIPFLVIDRPNLLIPAAQINKQKQVGIMTHACTSASFRTQIKDLDLIKICDSGVFLKSSNQQNLTYEELFDRYEEMSADYGIIFDVLGDARATIKSAEEAMRIYSSKRRSFKLIGVAQGQTVEEYVQCTARLIELGYQHIAIGGMLKKHAARYVKVKDNDFLIKVLEAVREVWKGWLFCLGCYHPSRVEIFEKYKIFGSDSKRWAFQCDRGLKTEDRHKQLINNFLQRNLSAGKDYREIQDGKLLGDISAGTQGDKLSIPCLIKQPHQEPIEATIIRETPGGVEGRGSQFDVQVNDQVIRVAKIYVFPKLLTEKKCRTTPDLSPSKKSRRDKGKGSGSVHYREVKRGLKTYRQAYFHYETWKSGDRLVKSSKYIPKKLESKIIRMNNEKESVEKILKVLESKSRRKKKS